jgi:DNA polymerase (family 10)
VNGRSWRNAKIKRPRAEIKPHLGLLLAQFVSANPDDPPEVLVAGSWRRGADPVGDLDVIVVNEVGSLGADRMHAGVRLPTCVERQRHGDKIANGTISLAGEPVGIHVDVWACTPMQRGAFLAFATGPMQLNLRQRAAAKRRGLALNQNGVFDRTTSEQLDDGTEEGVYAAIGWEYISPPDRQRWADK